MNYDFGFQKTIHVSHTLPKFCNEKQKQKRIQNKRQCLYVQCVCVCVWVGIILWYNIVRVRVCCTQERKKEREGPVHFGT